MRFSSNIGVIYADEHTNLFCYLIAANQTNDLTEIIIFFMFNILFSLLSKVFNGMSLEELQGLITEQEKLSIRAETEWEDSPVVREFGGCDSLSGKQSQEHGKHGTRVWSNTLETGIFYTLYCT